ncbi:peptide ABC transporter ATP-binding protein [Candidatus Epulonipiscium fishelsonii]|uniref:Peptide ABC transporter ATP-binding protein n=1 Tax=Candidatus Epulonipiscium fishelsonii TaxID=77094 RepID=A0ACC8XB15_9FIRM|nr:peptide ABC transporter ATP-binding protein [Epulopiscium sp. SCG-B05WGA-EpuloA1]ONI39458.1 peptide ABC transporter ATP-binding protein [Epulopiscium sp. SCG-B11WGA-EpuloA1]
MSVVLKVEDLSVEFKTERGIFKAVENISFELEEKKTLAIVGESGSGKSVTALAIMRLLAQNGKIPSGKVIFKGNDILKYSNKDMQRKILGQEISMIFQEPMTSLNPILKIKEQLMEGLIQHKNISKAKAYEAALEILTKVGIPSPKERLEQFPHQLSGGMRQRVMIAMGLICEPSVMIADEPTTALDVSIEAQILKLIEELKENMNTSILFITHDLNVVYDIADDVIVMYCGQIIEKRDVDSIFENPLHPYTKGLLGAMPKINEEVEILPTIEGTVPPINNRPKGCYFNTRCNCVMPICKENSPKLYKVDTGEVKCFLYENGGNI